MIGTTDTENIENLELSTTEECLPRVSFRERQSIIMNDKKIGISRDYGNNTT